MQVLKVNFYELMIRYYVHANDNLEIGRCYLHIFDTPSIKAVRNFFLLMPQQIRTKQKPHWLSSM